MTTNQPTASQTTQLELAKNRALRLYKFAIIRDGQVLAGLDGSNWIEYTSKPTPSQTKAEIENVITSRLKTIGELDGYEISDIDLSDCKSEMITALTAIIQAAEVRARIEDNGCPCTLIDPCSYACTCAKPFMSGGCLMCCRYGSLEQRKKAAMRLAELAKQADVKEQSWHQTPPARLRLR